MLVFSNVKHGLPMRNKFEDALWYRGYRIAPNAASQFAPCFTDAFYVLELLGLGVGEFIFHDQPGTNTSYVKRSDAEAAAMKLARGWIDKRID